MLCKTDNVSFNQIIGGIITERLADIDKMTKGFIRRFYQGVVIASYFKQTIKNQPI